VRRFVQLKMLRTHLSWLLVGGVVAVLIAAALTDPLHLVLPLRKGLDKRSLVDRLSFALR